MTAGSGTDASAALDQAWRSERTVILAGLTRRFGDLGRAEDAVQEAFAAAARHWPEHGVPDRPGAWLTTTARRKALDALRRDRSTPTGDDPVAGTEVSAGSDDEELDETARTDDVLSLVLTCCHPTLAPEAQVALTLRHIAGLSDRQIAARFLVAEATMTKRLVRARAKIRDARIRFGLPDRQQLAGRLTEVHAVVYLIFTEGYLASGDGPAIRRELCEEALWLARQLDRLVPTDAETTGLLALLLLHHARTAARTDPAGRLIPYADQDRSSWDHAAIAEAKALLARAPTTTPGPYRLQAAIALLHAAARGDDPNWAIIADLYTALLRQDPSPVLAVNRAVAVGRAHGPEAGLAALRPVLDEPRCARYVPLHAAHADLLERLRDPAADEAWQRAAALADNEPQRMELLRRRARVRNAAGTQTGPEASRATERK